MDNIERACVARADQGLHESEVTFGGEADLHKHLVECTKNPGHPNFIPVNEFSLNHLPSCYQDQDLFDCIKIHADLTVRIKVKHTSMARPKTGLGSDDSYPFYNYRGSSLMRVGSGWVSRAEEKFTDADNKSCPCQECVDSGNPEQEWGIVTVYTAAHVTFDTLEAEKTTCELFFDKNDDKSSVRTLMGFSVKKCSVAQDWCQMQCITHDLQLWDRLDQACRQCWQLQEKVRDRYFGSRDFLKMTIIVSHPHGCNKQVSLGEWTVREDMVDGYTKYTYKACTCPGSSGAPVIILGRRWWLYTEHPHSGQCGIDELNISACGYDVD